MAMRKARISYQSHNNKSNRWWVPLRHKISGTAWNIAGSCYSRIRELTDSVYVREQQQQQQQQGKNINNNGVAKAQRDDLAEL
jgi:hypothetical protein